MADRAEGGEASVASPPGGDEAEAVRVITFNTAVGNPKIETDQRDFLKLPFYREIIEGEPQAAILALQEVGEEQARALKEAAASGTFRLLHIKRPGQGNALLIPARYRVLEQRSLYYLRSQLAALVKALWRAARGRERFNRSQYFELRMWSRARLRDERSGRVFTIFNTHLSVEPRLRLAQAKSLFRRAHRARRDGPVIVAGDLNVRAARPAAPDRSGGIDAAVRALFPPLEDMAASALSRRPAIDYVLAWGFSASSARLYTGDTLELPGLASAEVISDHYAKEAVLRFD